MTPSPCGMCNEGNFFWSGPDGDRLCVFCNPPKGRQVDRVEAAMSGGIFVRVRRPVIAGRRTWRCADQCGLHPERWKRTARSKTKANMICSVCGRWIGLADVDTG